MNDGMVEHTCPPTDDIAGLEDLRLETKDGIKD
jgi:hypothetical protein